MPSFSFDISCQFDLQELKNALEMVKKEIITRYDFKNITKQVELKEEELIVTTDNDFTLGQIWDVITSKVVKRGLSPLIFDQEGKQEPASGGCIRKHYPLIQAIDTEDAKKITKNLKEHFKNAKAQIQAGEIRVTSNSKDELQAIIHHIKQNKIIDLPLQFGNYR